MTSADNVTTVFLRPGEIVVSAEPVVVTTLLGSCVAVTMFSARQQIGAICHGLLPSCRRDLMAEDSPDSGKYVECAIRLMLDGLAGRGVLKTEIEAKVFGGSDMFEIAEGRNHSVGRQNIEMALHMLEKESVRVIKQDLGGHRGRKIVFHSYSGEVFLKRLKKTEI